MLGQNGKSDGSTPLRGDQTGTAQSKRVLADITNTVNFGQISTWRIKLKKTNTGGSRFSALSKDEMEIQLEGVVIGDNAEMQDQFGLSSPSPDGIVNVDRSAATNLCE